MSTNPKGLHYRIRLLDAKRDARHGLAYVFVTFVLAGGSWLWDYRLISYLLLAIGGGVFLLDLVGDLITIIRCTRALKNGESQDKAGKDLKKEDIRADDVVRIVDFGLKHPPIRVEYPTILLATHALGIQHFLDAIESDKGGFLDRFEKFKQLQCKHYHHYSEFIPLLQIESLFLLPADKGNECRAMVWFSGELGEIWQSGYEDGIFADLYSE